MHRRLFVLTYLAMLACDMSLAKELPGVDANRFLNTLVGQWVGKAEITPIGPRPYDIDFKMVAPKRVEGTANPGGNTQHHWAFYEEGQQLHIRFLTTFLGNTTPIVLSAAKTAAGGVLFRSTDPALLSVRVKPARRLLEIDVFHWDKPHVSIRLMRR